MTREQGKLAGMVYHQGHSRQHWIDLVGIDPLRVEGIRVDGLGRCFWTAAAESAFNSRAGIVRGNWLALGVAS